MVGIIRILRGLPVSRRLSRRSVAKRGDFQYGLHHRALAVILSQAGSGGAMLSEFIHGYAGRAKLALNVQPKNAFYQIHR